MTDDQLFPAFLLGLVVIAMLFVGAWINTQTDAWSAAFGLLAS